MTDPVEYVEEALATAGADLGRLNAVRRARPPGSRRAHADDAGDGRRGRPERAAAAVRASSARGLELHARRARGAERAPASTDDALTAALEHRVENVCDWQGFLLGDQRWHSTDNKRVNQITPSKEQEDDCRRPCRSRPRHEAEAAGRPGRRRPRPRRASSRRSSRRGRGLRAGGRRRTAPTQSGPGSSARRRRSGDARVWCDAGVDARPRGRRPSARRPSPYRPARRGRRRARPRQGGGGEGDEGGGRRREGAEARERAKGRPTRGRGHSAYWPCRRCRRRSGEASPRPPRTGRWSWGHERLGSWAFGKRLNTIAVEDIDPPGDRRRSRRARAARAVGRPKDRSAVVRRRDRLALAPKSRVAAWLTIAPPTIRRGGCCRTRRTTATPPAAARWAAARALPDRGARSSSSGTTPSTPRPSARPSAGARRWRDDRGDRHRPTRR